MKQGPLRADCPAFAGVDEPNIRQISIDVRALHEPVATAIGGRDYLSGAAHSPRAVSDSGDGIKASALPLVRCNQLPGSAMVVALHDGCVSADDESTIVNRK